MDALIAEFYYKNIWTNKGQVRLYIDKDGHLTRKPSAYYINTYEDYGDKTKDMIKQDIERRAREHQEEYAIRGPQSILGKYVDQMRRTVDDWKK